MDRYSRQTLFSPVGPRGQERIERARVLIVGCGALGTHSAEYLARAGVGSIRLVDRDLVEWSNLGRQIGFTEEDARRRTPKAIALARHLGEVNSTVAVEPRAMEFDHRSALDLAADRDLLVDGTDNALARYLLNDVSYRLGRPWIYAGVIEARGVVQAFSGDAPPCLRCTWPEMPPPGSLATCDTAGVLGPAVAAVAGWQATLALRILVDGGAANVAGRQVRLAVWDLEARISRVLPDASCPLCGEGCTEFLDGEHREEATALCGREAVLVRPVGDSFPALASLVGRLERLGTVEDRELFLRVQAPECTVTVFPDGRAIFDGLTDEAQARSLYARFVGQ
ncbi:MAG: ThiF family adenylyltransferase [Planctomycetota bacterium]|nr:ThiF family adenylyltransferase [Planctomycetota bacterium]